MTVKIGAESRRKEYQIHKAVLTHHSEFFRAAFEALSLEEGASNEASRYARHPVGKATTLGRLDVFCDAERT